MGISRLHTVTIFFSRQSDLFFTITYITRIFFFPPLSNGITSGHSNRKETMVQHLVGQGRRVKRCVAATCQAGRPACHGGAWTPCSRQRCPRMPEGPRGGGHVPGLHLCGPEGPTGQKGKSSYDKFRDSFREQDKSFFVYRTESSCTILWINLPHLILKPYLKKQPKSFLWLSLKVRRSNNLRYQPFTEFKFFYPCCKITICQ